MFAGKKSAQIREILISESAWEEMTCLFAPSLVVNVNFFVTCIGDALKSRMARDSVLLLEKLGCRVNFPEKQGCCGQPAINSGYIKEAIPGMKNLIAALEDNDDPIISPAGSCTYAVKVTRRIWRMNLNGHHVPQRLPRVCRISPLLLLIN
ncbi:hydroxyacid oxidoreductase (Fe-S centre) [Escherichia coli]|nr:hydroxyacid oxidoreductase (Fe-S centre) [Escherichia coli]